MAEKELILEPEVKQIFNLINDGKNFLLSGGAGSGKTYSLVQVIREAIRLSPTAKVACMTFTNAAVKEIEDRVNHKNLTVSTIHDFLWDCIKPFQRELKKALINLINDETLTQISISDGLVTNDFYDNLEEGIQYKEWLSLKDGIISHDELLILANYMYANYPKLADILKDKFDYIFIDEYQDTSQAVVDIFLTHLQLSSRKNIIGFFGDSMQAIYEDGIGDLNKYIINDSPNVFEVKKEQNRRNPKSVIDLANIIRTDGLQQIPSADTNAPNMVDGYVKQGITKFIYTNGLSLNDLKTTNYFEGWNFENAKQTKELNLTHNLIAPKAGYPTLMAIYDKDPIISLKNDVVRRIKERTIPVDEGATFDEVVLQVNLVNIRRVPKRDVILEDPDKARLYNLLKDLPFNVVKKIYLDKDSLIDDKKQDETAESKKGSKRDNLVKHLFKIQFLIFLYQTKQYNEFLRRTEIRVRSSNDKKVIKEIIDTIYGMSENTIEEVIDFADKKGICIKDDRYNKFTSENEYLFNRVKNVQFREFQNLFAYLEGFTPFSTQHKIKGAEFDNVLVILDNGGWNSKYNFQQLFLGGGSESVLKNSQKIFYVCCTRAKENLIVFYESPNAHVIEKAKEWFGVGNVHEV